MTVAFSDIQTSGHKILHYLVTVYIWTVGMEIICLYIKITLEVNAFFSYFSRYIQDSRPKCHTPSY